MVYYCDYSIFLSPSTPSIISRSHSIRDLRIRATRRVIEATSALSMGSSVGYISLSEFIKFGLILVIVNMNHVYISY
jgi:hypothetical protein